MKPERVFNILSILGKITSIWPSKLHKKNYVKFAINCQWYFLLLNSVGLIIPLILGVYHNRHQPVLMMKTLSELTAIFEVFFNLILCKIQRQRLEILLNEVDDFIKTAKPNEKKILHKYVNRYFYFCVFVGISFFQTAIAFSLGPLVTTSIVPADTWYIFSFETFSIVHLLIYTQQMLAIAQTGMSITVDFMVALLLAYVATRIEILNVEFNNVVDKKTLNYCIKKHHHFIEFVNQLRLAVRFIVLKSNVAMAMAVIFGAFPLIYHEPLPVISQFILMVIGGCLRLYITAWPADDLKHMSNQIAWSIYDSAWIGKSKELQKSVEIVIRRSQKPLVIFVHGVLPALSLEFYGTFLSSTLSYFMTLRAIIGK